MNIFAIREFIDCVKDKFGDEAFIVLFTDGSGYIRLRTPDLDKLLEEFDDLGKLASILEK